MQLNSLYQLLALQNAGSPALKIAKTFLNMPDLFNFWLSGCKASEFTIATTTQCFDPRQNRWAAGLLNKLEIPTHIFQPVIKPATILDLLLPSVAAETGTARVSVVAVGGHDTASAVAAVPAETDDFIYLSSGTWSLIGVELSQPLITPEALACDFTNEGGLNNKIRFLKSIMGMWLLQECRREWAKTGQTFSYDELSALAQSAPAFQALISPGDAFFLAPGGMPARIQAYCRKTGQNVPQTPGEIVRCILESLALEYRNVVTHLRTLLNRPLTTLHIIGGGSRNRLLNQFTAASTGCRVVAGPVEATALGNALAQALALGHISSLAEGRAIVRRSFDVQTFEPGSSEIWDAAYQRYLQLNLEVQ
jgi:rhamnulokinase